MPPGLDGRWSVERCWRLVMTALLYVAFGAGALLSTIVAVIPVIVFSTDKASRNRRVRRLNQFAFNGFTRAANLLGVFKMQFRDDHLLDLPAQIIIANHPSLLDVVFLLGRVTGANCVVKKSLLRNPFLALQVKHAGYIMNDAGEELLAHCNDCLERGESLIIFPEGTRTVRDEEVVFKRGAAYLMLLGRAMVRPVHIKCQPVALGKHDPWYAVPEQRIDYLLTVLPAIDLDHLRNSDQIGLPLKGRRLTRLLVDWYRQLDQSASQPLPAIPDTKLILRQKK